MPRTLIGYLAVAAVALALGGLLGAIWYRSKLQTAIYFNAHHELYRLSKARNPVVMLGDSLTASAPWNELTACPNVVNRGVSGDQSADVLARLDDVVALKPSAVFLMIGINDLARGVAPADTATNIGRIAGRLSAAPVLVHSVLPIGSVFTNAGMVLQGVSELNARIEAALKTHGNAELIDLRPRVTTADGHLKPELTSDGVHLTPAAYAIWRDAIEPKIMGRCRP